MRGIKFVPLEHANAVSEGRLRIGTLRDYGRLEGPRADPYEGTVTFSNEGSFTAADPQYRHLVALGFDTALPSDADAASIQYIGCTFSSQVPNFYCFCASNALTAAPPEPHAAFEILGVKSLAKAISAAAYEAVGWRSIIRKVTYLPREQRLTDPLRPPNPFVKDPAFEREDELRIIWPEPVRREGVGDEEDQGIVSFNLSNANEQIANLLRRLY